MAIYCVDQLLREYLLCFRLHFFSIFNEKKIAYQQLWPLEIFLIFLTLEKIQNKKIEIEINAIYEIIG